MRQFAEVALANRPRVESNVISYVASCSSGTISASEGPLDSHIPAPVSGHDSEPDKSTKSKEPLLAERA